jgi:hypothetical protein
MDRRARGAPERYDLLRAWEAGAFASRADLVLVTDWTLNRPLPAAVSQQRGIRGSTLGWSAAWHAADIFVMPTVNEAFGLVFQEAGAAGLPTIATRLNAIPEIVTDGETGVLIAPRDIDQLAAALDRLIGSAELRTAMGRAARRKIEREASPVEHRRQLLGLIRDLTRQDQHG